LEIFREKIVSSHPALQEVPMHAYRSFAVRCRANTAHIRQSKPDSGPGCQANVLKTFYGVPPEILQVMSLRALKEVVKALLKVMEVSKVVKPLSSPSTTHRYRRRRSTRTATAGWATPSSRSESTPRPRCVKIGNPPLAFSRT